MGRPYDDEWILKNWESVRNWNTLCNEYNRVHNDNRSYNTFKSHCNRELCLNFLYSEEQEKFLMETYPVCGRIKTAQLFNERFQKNKSPQAIKVHCVKNLKLKVTKERKAETAIENSGNYKPVGTITSKTHGELYVKTENGWKRLKEVALGKPPKGYLIVHLDGNVANNNPDDLAVISMAVNMKMTKNDFWSENSEITRAGIMSCELELMLKNGSEKVPASQSKGNRKQESVITRHSNMPWEECQ